MNADEQRISKGRSALVLDHPFFGALSLRLNPKAAPGRTKTIATDGRDFLYNPEYLQSITDEELVWMWARMTMHPALQHNTRRGHRDQGIWNRACANVVSLILDEAHLQRPGDQPFDPRFKGMSAEQVHTILEQEEAEQQQQQKQEEQQEEQSAEDGDDQGGAEGGGEGDSDGGGDEGDDDGDGNGAGQGEGQGGEGSGNDSPGEVLDAQDPAQDEAEWQVAVKQATNAAQMMGKLPGGMKSAVEEATKPRVDWRSLLRRFVQQCAKADYSWRMPNRRYIGRGIFLPEIRSEEMPPICVVADTSGSTMSVRAMFMAELQSIVDECRPEATIVVHCDAAVHGVERFERGESIDIKEWLGNGGTDFRPAFDYVDQEQLQPACLIYLTDGCGTYPDLPADYPTLWAMTTNWKAPWGETVRIDE